MANIFKRSLAIFAVLGGVFFATATPALANANTSVICGWDKQDPATGARMAFYYRNDLTAKSTTAAMSDDEYQRAMCDGANGKKGAIDQLADVIVGKYGSLNGWAKKRYETTWADRCNDSDYIAVYFGSTRNACPAFVKGQVNYAKSGQATPHDLLSCMYNGRSYYITYDGSKVVFSDLQNGKYLAIGDAQLNCLPETPYQTK